jgi:hypothetical protein
MRDKEVKAQTSEGKIVTNVFWDKRYVQTLKKLKQRILRVRLNRNMNQVLLLPPVPI